MSETISSRTFEITQYETDPKTGKPLFSEENIRFALLFQTIDRWSYIRHDKAVYSEEDEAKWNKQLAEYERPALDESVEKDLNDFIARRCGELGFDAPALYV